MHSGSRVKKSLLSGGAKALFSFVLLALVFSPIGQIFQTPSLVHAAQTYVYCVDSGGTILAPVNKNGNCSAGTAKSFDAPQTVTGGAPALCNSIASCILLPVYAITVGLGGFVAYIGSFVFNAAAQLSLNSSAYSLQFVTNGWTTARDIANMGFILILIYIAVNIILSAETAHTMETLALVIFIALIINFSFFLTRVVIDAGNIVALEFYNNIPTVTIANGQPATAAGVKDLTASIMNAVGAQQILGSKSFDAFQNSTDGFTEFITLLIVYIFVGAIYFVLAAAFVSVGIKFIVRIAVLWLMIIASPLALIAKASHRFEKYYDDWQETLIANVFYPAVFLFIFWLITQFASDLNINQTFLENVTNNPGGSSIGSSILQIGTIVAGISIRLGFIIVMLFLGMQAADKMGAMGGKLAANITSKLPGFSGLASYARFGGTLSNRIGPGAWAGYADDKLKNSRVGNSAFGYGLRQVVTKPVAGAKIGGAESRTELKDRWDKENKEKKLNKRITQNLPAIQELQALEDENAATPFDPLTAVGQAKIKRRADLQDRVNNLSGAEVGAIQEKDLQKYANLFSENVIKKIMDSDKVSDDGKQAIRDKYNREGKDAAITKANRQIDLLREIRDDLSSSGAVGFGVHTNLMALLDNKGGSLVDSKNIQKALTEVRKEIALQQQEARKNPVKALAEKAEEAALHLREMQTKLNKLDEERGKVPVAVGDEAEAGKFKTKKK